MTTKPDGNTDDFWRSISLHDPDHRSPALIQTASCRPTVQDGYGISPYVLLNHTGYYTFWENRGGIRNVGLEQDLSFITQGLNVPGQLLL